MKRSSSLRYFVMVSISFMLISWGAPPKSFDGGPSVVFDSLVYDFGTIKKHADGTCHFTFTNKGGAPLLITRVSASCGCTVPSYPKEPVLPGEKGSVSVKYNTKTLGVFSKTISVSTNDALHATITLTIKGNVVK